MDRRPVVQNAVDSVVLEVAVRCHSQVVAVASERGNWGAPSDWVLHQGDSLSNPQYTMMMEGLACFFCGCPSTNDHKIVNSHGHHVGSVEVYMHRGLYEYVMNLDSGVNVAMIWALVLCRAAMLKEQSDSRARGGEIDSDESEAESSVADSDSS
mmetsp:Transcript_13352/g.29983  ORF Transcript_13352/g.29983 Transcript_13352/m.29983 type:complete len:154 (+) Transcript_13352:344-805(+)